MTPRWQPDAVDTQRDRGDFGFLDGPPVETLESAGVPCDNCGAANPTWTWVEYTGPTGVVAPDGGQEWQRQNGWKCGECGMIEEEQNG